MPDRDSGNCPLRSLVQFAKAPETKLAVGQLSVLCHPVGFEDRGSVRLNDTASPQ